MKHIFTGSGAPSTTPAGIGHHYIDTVGKVTYVSVGTSSSADWQASTASIVAADLAAHEADVGNPHSVTKAQVGLGNADNTSDANKPVSTAQQTALNLKANLASPAFTGTPSAPTPSPGDNSTKLATTAFVANSVPVVADATTSAKGILKLAGDLGGTADLPTVPGLAGKEDVGVAASLISSAISALTKSSVGLGNVDNTSDANKPVSTAQATAIGVVQSDIDTHEADTGNPHSVTKTQVGLGNVDNTSDANKPISTATQTALDARLRFVGDWDTVDPNHQYFPNDVVNYVGLYWRAKLEQHGATPGADSGTYWEPVVQLGSSGIFHAADGDVTNPTYGFASDDGTDTGMYWVSDGVIGWATNGVQKMRLRYDDGLFVNGYIDTASGYKNGSAAAHKLTAFDNAGILQSLGQFGYDPATFHGARWIHEVIPDATNDNKLLHQLSASLNPTAAAQDSWQIAFIEANLGTDDSGFQVGDPTDIKSVLVVQDITFSSRRNGTDGDVITIEYTTGGTAGAEVVSSPSSFVYQVQIEDGVSTAQQIYNAIQASNVGDINGAVAYEITGTSSNPQVAFGPTNLAGGENRQGQITVLNLNLNSRNKSDMAASFSLFNGLDFGNGTDAIRGGKYQAIGGNSILHDNTRMYGFSVLEHGLNFHNNSIVDGDLRGFDMFGTVGQVTNGVLGVSLSFNAQDIQYANMFQNTIHVFGNVERSVNVFADFGNYDADIGDNYYGVAIQPNINSCDGIFGFNFGPNVAMARQNSIGVNVSMNNVTAYAGVKASVTVQDLHYEALQPGSGNNSLAIAYVNDGTAGSESISIAGTTVSVHMEDGVSTAQQIHDALVANTTFASNVLVTITGTASNPQTAVGATNLAGGVNSGNKKAAQFNGDVDIQGSLSFTGALALGALNAFHSQPLADGGGAPGSIHTLISAPTVGDNITLTSADMLGINTAMLLTVGHDSNVGTAFLGISALGLPAVISIGANSTVDKVAGATFALSLDSGAGAGSNIDNVYLCRALGLPNGVTTVGNLYGYEMDMPFGDIGTNAWGVYIKPDIQNWMKGSLKIGGTAGSTDKTVGGLSFQVEGDTQFAGAVNFGGAVGFFGTSAVNQQTSSGAQTAGVVYTATEQAMIQEMYDALRAYGLLS